MLEQKISHLEKIKIFLNEYYLGYGIYFSLVRIIGGPMILLMGLYYYGDSSSRLGISYSGFLLFFGIYYTLKPFIFILIKKPWFRNFDLTYQVEKDNILIKSDKSESTLSYSEFKTIKKRKTYFVLRTKSNQGIYLPIQLLSDNEIQILDELIN